MYQGRLTSISPRSRPRVNASPRTSTGSAGDPSTGRAGARVPPSGSRPRGEVNPSRRSDPSPPSRQLHTPRRATSAKEAALLGISGGPPRAAPRHRYGGPTTWARNSPCPPAARGAEPRPATCADAIRPCAASARRGEAGRRRTARSTILRMPQPDSGGAGCRCRPCAVLSAGRLHRDDAPRGAGLAGRSRAGSPLGPHLDPAAELPGVTRSGRPPMSEHVYASELEIVGREHDFYFSAAELMSRRFPEPGGPSPV